MFADQSWPRVSPRAGACLAEGAVRSEREAKELAEQGRPLVSALGDRVTYGGRRVALCSDGLDIEHDERDEAEAGEARLLAALDGPSPEPPGPTPGAYPIDEWQPARYLGLVGGRLAVLLEGGCRLLNTRPAALWKRQQEVESRRAFTAILERLEHRDAES